MPNKLEYSFSLLLIFTFFNIQLMAQDSLQIWDDTTLAKFQLVIPSETTWEENGIELVKLVATPILYKFLPKPALSTGMAVIICPGGGYGLLAIRHEGIEVAQRLQAKGIAAFVLKSRLPNPEHWKNASYAPLSDLDKAVSIVEEHATEWGIDVDKIGVMGFSAGGHLAASLSIPDLLTDRLRTKEFPAFSALIYPVISMMDDLTHQGSQHNLLGKDASETQKMKFSGALNTHAEMGPVFLVHTMDDGAVKVNNVLSYASAIAEHHHNRAKQDF